MTTDRTKSRRMWKRLRLAAVVLVAVYLLLGILIAASAWADAQSSQSEVFPWPGITTARPPSGSSDAVVKRYYDYLQAQTYQTLRETYNWDWRSLLGMYGILGIVIGGLYVFAYAWYTGKLRHDDLYAVEVYNGYISERGSPFDIFNYYVWSIMFIYVVVYVVVTLIYGQLY